MSKDFDSQHNNNVYLKGLKLTRDEGNLHSFLIYLVNVKEFNL